MYVLENFHSSLFCSYMYVLENFHLSLWASIVTMNLWKEKLYIKSECLALVIFQS